MSPVNRDRLAGAIVCLCVAVWVALLLFAPEISATVRGWWR